MTNDEVRKIKNDVTEVGKSYVTRYVDALWENYSNGTAIDYEDLGFWTFPVLFIAGMEQGPTGGAEASHVGIYNKDKLDESVRTLYRGFYNQGMGKRADLDWSEVTVISPNCAIIETKGTRYKQDDTPFNTWHACYWMHRVEGNWKQFGVAEPAAPQPSVTEWVSWLESAVAR